MKRDFSMRPNLNFVISEPFISLDEYCRRTGICKRTARKMCNENRLPIRRKVGGNGLIEVNMLALIVEAAGSYHITMQA
ncbi:regulator [Pantoea sp. Bo_7]|uniref:helix-turn-helix transcriptional regulator n=1 Tax=unclassified Pantoea TaxID=2630326 RepID=UPI001231C5CF|nr:MULTISPECIES: regulator [unclassified Pantoea]KAA6046667.1 regulator [Pantoea sp. Bo_7]KAA6091897.1 regulator [Pantoea sp. Bo_10]